ncbi:16460_t:CDS:2 [Entrophospora sp. SA101]|nr:16460_t:CDS:2 [Entrophospora sp. SA101]
MHKDNDADKISSSKLDGGDKYGDNNEKTCRPENLNSLQNNVKNLAKNLDSNVTNRIDTIENDIKEIKELLKLNFNK